MRGMLEMLIVVAKRKSIFFFLKLCFENVEILSGYIPHKIIKNEAE